MEEESEVSDLCKDSKSEAEGNTCATVSTGEKEEGVLGWSRSFYRIVLVQLYLQTRSFRWH